MLAKVVLLVSVITYCHGMHSMIDVIGANNGSMMVSLIKAVNLTAIFSAQGPFTVLVPVDAAFAAIPTAESTTLTANVDKLAKILKYHVIVGEVFSYDFVYTKDLITLMGQNIELSTMHKPERFNNARVLATDFEAINGVVHLIDRVLSFPERSVMNILDSPDHNLTEFAAMVRRSHTDGRLSYANIPDDKYTIFAPSDAAFAKLPDDVRARLTSSSSLAEKEIVIYHIHHGSIDLKSRDYTGSITTLLTGHNIRVDVDSTGIVILNGKTTFAESDEANNGVVYIIDNVLVPENLGHIIG